MSTPKPDTLVPAGPGIYRCPRMTCAEPGPHRTVELPERGVVCPGCRRVCPLPEGIGRDALIKTVG